MRRRNGQSLVEAALVLTAFMALVMGMVWVGQSLFMKQTLVTRAHDAARWGALNPYDASAIRNMVLYGAAKPDSTAVAVMGLKPTAIVVENPDCPGPDCRIRVAIPGEGVQSTEPVEAQF